MDDIARFQRFCQLRRQICGSGDHLIVGIDIAKDKHHAFFGTATGQSLWRRFHMKRTFELEKNPQMAGSSVDSGA